jgi:hypothetical protein
MGIREEVGGARQFVTDRRVEALLVGEARRRAVTRAFEIPGEKQSLLVTLILAGTAATVLGDLVARPLPRLSGGDAAIGGAALNAALGAMVGTSLAAPLAGGLITFAVVAHAVRPVMSGSARRGRAHLHEVRAAYDLRYAS